MTKEPPKTPAKNLPLDAPTPAVDSDKAYSMVYYGSANRALSHAHSKNALINEAGEAVIKGGDYQVSIKNFRELASSGIISGLKTSTAQLLCALTQTLTGSGVRSLRASLHLDDLMSMRGLKDRKETRKQVDGDLKTLSNLRLSFTNRKKGTEKNYYNMQIFSFTGIKNSIICVTFGQDYCDILSEYGTMPLSPLVYRVNTKKYRHAYYFLMALLAHKNINYTKRNADTISVKTLLDSSPIFPSYEKVMTEMNRAVSENIIEPFEKNMDALAEDLSWEFRKAGGEALTDKERGEMNYALFIELMVAVQWKNYPERQDQNKGTPPELLEEKTGG